MLLATLTASTCATAAQPIDSALTESGADATDAGPSLPWELSGSFQRCTPGRGLLIGYTPLPPAPTCGIGSCGDDPAFRVCGGDRTTPECASGVGVLGEVAHACADRCVTLMIACPPAGSVQVLTAPADPLVPSNCHPNVIE